ncbi:DNA polymerase III subunit beta [Arthrobacter sp. VKM Ac-2550]|uniref:DNA polymerase III subunit beta n=1 Tax=Crystallibacter permensis TaxID=1938888 RepID=UPI002226B8C4|nr:DNA polymerase III subunit beta [Arthrobacter sp. VKM Ac-2550]MCW2132926.1 DNA polymerase III, beta subunit [Arthrobacter sp. VKM Ac-2550]
MTKIRIDSTTFAEAAVFAAKAISPRPATPVLSGLLIEAAEGTIRLSGFDYEVSNRITAPAEVLDAGHVLVPGRMLTDILSKLPKNRPVEVTVDGTRVSITSGKAKYTLSTMPAAEFPAMPELPAKAGTVDGHAFAAAVAQVAGTAANDDTLPILAAVHVVAEGKELRLSATDRYRLAERTIPWEPVDPETSFAWLIKSKTLVDVSKLAAGELQVLSADDKVGFRNGNRATTSLTVDGDYPKISALFPDNTPINVTVNRAMLADVVSRVSTVAERNTPLRLQVRDGEIELDAGTGEDAQGREFMDCELDGDPITAAFNPAYLEHALKTMPTETVIIGFTASPKPAVITPTDDTDLRHLLMPVRLPGA